MVYLSIAPCSVIVVETLWVWVLVFDEYKNWCHTDKNENDTIFNSHYRFAINTILHVYQFSLPDKDEFTLKNMPYNKVQNSLKHFSFRVNTTLNCFYRSLFRYITKVSIFCTFQYGIRSNTVGVRMPSKAWCNRRPRMNVIFL